MKKNKKDIKYNRIMITRATEELDEWFIKKSSKLKWTKSELLRKALEEFKERNDG